MVLSSIQKKAQAGEVEQAQLLLVEFLTDLFPLKIASVQIRRDSLSLNSVNGFIYLREPDVKTGANELFFKFHHEENEDVLKEYYNSQLLQDGGFPVEMPVYASQEVGKQVLLYQVKKAERLFDVCKRNEFSGAEFADVIKAQEDFDDLSCARYLDSLHLAGQEELQEEPILQLFYNRLVDDAALPLPLGEGRGEGSLSNNGTIKRGETSLTPALSQRERGQFGGRFVQFYQDKDFIFSECTINFNELKNLKWRINGIEYKETLHEAFVKALNILSPKAHLSAENKYPALVAHGDAHNGNVWFNAGNPPSLSLFDPAFAGLHIPALLAEIKTTFHNIFAHPLWLYDSVEADKNLDVSLKIKDNYVEITHNWQLSPLREAFLTSKQERIWKPLLQKLKYENLLPENWQDYMRSALFCCPSLVMNLRSYAGNNNNFHTQKTSALGLSISMMLSSAPVNGNDVVSNFFAKVQPK